MIYDVIIYDGNFVGKINILNQQKWRFGSDDFPFQFLVIFRLKVLIFRGEGCALSLAHFSNFCLGEKVYKWSFKIFCCRIYFKRKTISFQQTPLSHSSISSCIDICSGLQNRPKDFLVNSELSSPLPRKVINWSQEKGPPTLNAHESAWEIKRIWSPGRLPKADRQRFHVENVVALVKNDGKEEPSVPFWSCEDFRIHDFLIFLQM